MLKRTAALGLLALLLSASANAAEKANCRVTAGTSSGFKHVTLICAKAETPHIEAIRLTIWESEDPEGYRSAAKDAGRKFVCDLLPNGQSATTTHIVTYYELENCS